MICRAGRKSNNVRFFSHHMTNLHGEFQTIAACFAKFVRINLTWTYNHLIICKYGKQDPIFNTIKDGKAHRACSVESRFVKPNEKDTQRPNVWENISKKLHVEVMTCSPVFIAYPSEQGLKITLYRG